MRVVLDTNTALSALLFRRGRLNWIRDHWTGGRFVPLCSPATSGELIRVLAYPKFRLTESEIHAVVGSYFRYAQVIHIVPDDVESLPRCRDPKDQMFLELAECGKADVLVTGDQDLLELADRCTFSIDTPAEFKKRFVE